MSVRVRIDLDGAAIDRLAAPGSPVYRQVQRIGGTVATVARLRAPVDTGRLRQAIDVNMISEPPKLTARVVVPVNYAASVHDGHKVIVPKTKKVLRFTVPGGGVVYAKRVKATAGKPFLTDAAREVTGKEPHPL